MYLLSGVAVSTVEGVLSLVWLYLLSGVSVSTVEGVSGVAVSTSKVCLMSGVAVSTVEGVSNVWCGCVYCLVWLCLL